MNINYKPSQIELFPAQGVELENIQRPRWLSASLSLSMESLVILSFLGIMISLLSFALGVELGKRQVAQLMDDNVNLAWRVNARRAQVASEARTAAVVATQATAPVTQKSISAPVVSAKAKPVNEVKKVAPVAAASKRYTVQLGTFQNQKYAQDEAMKLKAKGLTVFIVKSGKFWLLCTGQFATAQEAQQLSKKLPATLRNSPIRRF